MNTETGFDTLPPDATTDSVFPWPPAAGASLLDAFVNTWKQAVFHPSAFFRRMPRAGEYGHVIVYYLVVGVVVAGIDLFWNTILGGFGLGALLVRNQATHFDAVIEFLLSPVILLVTLYLVTCVCHLILLILRDGENGFETSSRVFAFSYSPALFSVFPIVGGLVAFVWMIALAIAGLREAHETDGAKAAVAVLVPVFFVLSMVVFAIIAGVLFGVLNTRI